MLLLSLLVSIVGSDVVLRGLGFMTMALSHAIFPGVVLGALLNLNILLLSMLVALVISLLIGVTGRSSRVGHTSAIASLYTGSFAAGIMLISYTGLNRRLSEFLFGRLFGVGWEDIFITLGVVLLTLVAFAITRKEILLASFDPAMARAQGLPLLGLELGFLALLALVVVSALPAVGNILIVALLVTPPATARLITSRLPAMMLFSGLLSVLGSVTGLYLAFHLNLPPGAVVVLVLTTFFLLVFFFSPRHGLLMARFTKPQ
jgi:ABC-type Mn2+/Zn2+ transport system permease subunit